MPDFGSFRGFGEKLMQGQTPTQLGKIGSEQFEFDPDSVLFFERVTNSGGILSDIEKTATNQLLSNLKDYGLWSKVKAIYPMVGASAAACAQNLKSSSFTGVFVGGVTYASTGVTGNGTSGYFDTNLNVLGNLDNSSYHTAFYSRSTSSVFTRDFGAAGGSTTGFYCIIRDINSNYIMSATNENQAVSVSNTDGRGLYTINRSSSTLAQGRKNGSSVMTITASNSGTMPNLNMYAMRINGVAAYSSKECALFSIGDGLTDTQSADFYTAVQAFQTTLSRQV
jgi:hypothetical protein